MVGVILVVSARREGRLRDTCTTGLHNVSSGSIDCYLWIYNNGPFVIGEVAIVCSPDLWSLESLYNVGHHVAVLVSVMAAVMYD